MKKKTQFEWDESKNKQNQKKHSIPFKMAQYAFADVNRIILEDIEHNVHDEKRYYCVGKVIEGIVTVRFTYRENRVRIYGAGFWRKGKKIYEEQNKIQ